MIIKAASVKKKRWEWTEVLKEVCGENGGFFYLLKNKHLHLAGFVYIFRNLFLAPNSNGKLHTHLFIWIKRRYNGINNKMFHCQKTWFPTFRSHDLWSVTYCCFKHPIKPNKWPYGAGGAPGCLMLLLHCCTLCVWGSRSTKWPPLLFLNLFVVLTRLTAIHASVKHFSIEKKHVPPFVWSYHWKQFITHVIFYVWEISAI